MGTASGIPVQCRGTRNLIAHHPAPETRPFPAAGHMPKRIRLQDWLLPYSNGLLFNDMLLPHHCGSFFHMAHETVCIYPQEGQHFPDGAGF